MGAYRGVKHQALIDRDNHNYALISLGWDDQKKYVHNISFHIEIIDGKVWVHQNNTEEMIADELVEKGVRSQDIVLGFLPERDRKYSGFAVV